jgi:tetratricopeptide (TPR) repeat protein
MSQSQDDEKEKEEEKDRDEARNQSRTRGNELFKRGQYDEAVEHYTHALSIETLSVDENAKVLTNRSAAYAKLEMWSQSLLDAERAIEMDGSALRAHYRKGIALLELGCLPASLSALEDALALDPTHVQVLATMAHLQARIRDSFRAGRTDEVHRAKVKFQSSLEERVFAESLASERQGQQRRQRREDQIKRKAYLEEQQRAFYDHARNHLNPGITADAAHGGEEEENYYEVLGLSDEGCPASTVRKHYLRLLSKCHPDKPEGTRERFDSIKRAYDTLSSAERRIEYDLCLRDKRLE